MQSLSKCFIWAVLSLFSWLGAFALVDASEADALRSPRPAGAEQLQGMWPAWGGEARFEFERSFVDAFGILGRLTAVPDPAGRRIQVTAPLSHDEFLEFRALGRSFEGFYGGQLVLLSGPVLHGADGRQVALTGSRILPSASDPYGLSLVDTEGRILFELTYLHYWLHESPDRIEVRNANLVVTPALAELLGRTHAAGQVAGVFGFDSWSEFEPMDKVMSSCASPVWPGTPGTVTDVELIGMGGGAPSFGSCVGTCTGTSSDARVYWAPDATLRNIGTADVPWWDWIDAGNASPQPPYGNRQHPILIWNMYRIDADGGLAQIGRSGVKHAYFAVNNGCSCSGGHILWAAINTANGVGCADTYSSGNNNESQRLGPRSEVVPKQAIWGRCGSVFDPDCTGIATDHGIGPPAHRMVVRESDITVNLNPGAAFYLEAWYLVRDDVNIYNTMRSARGSAFWDGSIWSNFVYANDTQMLGPVIDRWVVPDAPDPNAMNRELATAEGHAKLAVRVTALGGGQYRYDYALMNFDFARAVTTGSEPNISVLSNHGFDQLRVPVTGEVAVSDIQSLDGAGLITEWDGVYMDGAIVWTAPSQAATLDWGSMLRFSFVADAAPDADPAQVRVYQPGSPSQYAITTLGPNQVLIFRGTFE